MRHQTKELREMGLKRCYKCSEIKPFSEFYRAARKFDGVQSQCKTCTGSHKLAWRKNNLQRAKEYDNKWKRENYPKIKSAIRTKNLKLVADLPDCYVRQLFRDRSRPGSHLEPPDELIEIKRLQVTLKRILRDAKRNQQRDSVRVDA